MTPFCTGTLQIFSTVSNSQNFAVPHNHESEDERIDDARQKGFLSMKTLGEASLEYDVKASIKVDLIREESAPIRVELVEGSG